MSKSISEYVAKTLFANYNTGVDSYTPNIQYRLIIDNQLIKQTGYIYTSGSDQKFVVKVDQQVKGRMKKGLIGLDLTLPEIELFVRKINKLNPSYTTFIVEPSITRCVKRESYVLIQNVGSTTRLTFNREGGIAVTDVDTFDSIEYDILPTDVQLERFVSECIKHSDLEIHTVSGALKQIANFYRDHHLTFLEINPLCITADNQWLPLDMLVKYDSAATYLFSPTINKLLESDTRTVNSITNEERIINDLASKTGASLKFTLLKPDANVWFLLFGGGASVCYFDKQMKIAESIPELIPANYGEISGNPSREFTAQYTEQIISLMKKSSTDLPKKYLVIGGGIANFTQIDVTFDGIIDAIKKNIDYVRENVKIFVRRGGPNDLIALKNMRKFCDDNQIEAHIHDSQYSMTKILDDVVINYFTSNGPVVDHCNNCDDVYSFDDNEPLSTIALPSVQSLSAFDLQTLTELSHVIYGYQLSVAQNMLDYDTLIGRSEPSVACFVNPTAKGITNVPLFFKHKSILVPVYPSLLTAVSKHQVNSVVNFSSYRTAYRSTLEAMGFERIKFISILAEGIAENHTKELIGIAREKNVILLGPSTVGAIVPGFIRIGNVCGTIENIVAHDLHLARSAGIKRVGIVTRSGGLLNELCHVVHSAGRTVAAAVAIGGDRYVGTSFVDVVKSYYQSDSIDEIVLLGEVGGTAELDVANWISQQTDKQKKVYGLCLGVSAESDVLRIHSPNHSESIQFGHSGAEAQTALEKASYKNNYMRVIGGITVPKSWENWFDNCPSIETVRERSPPVPIVTTNRKHPKMFSSISDERGEVVRYNDVPVSEISSIGQTIGLLWFKKKLPDSIAKYIELITIVCADHGPCVSGAQNTIITTRAGKDMVTSLTTGLLTIGPKFGGAINNAAAFFYTNWKKQADLIVLISQSGIIPGIGHKHYSIHNPDRRIVVLEEHCSRHFPTELLSFARQIETITTQKRSNLILNVDGFVAVTLIDALSANGFDDEDITELINNEIFNAFFILARTIGFIGHHIDQKRLKQDLFRADDEEIGYC